MWNSITHLFSRKSEADCETTTVEVAKMEHPHRSAAAGVQPSSGDPEEAYDSRQAKQRASIKWLLSKAFNNRVPDNLHEPFYRDHEGQCHLKPHIVHTLANAELYCLALGNIYADPNFHNLNHSGIVQALIRKGVTPEAPGPECPLTETTLIQTTPIRLSAHLSIIDSLMALYVKEVATADAISAAITRLSHQHAEDVECPRVTSPQQGLLAWLNCCSSIMNARLRLEGAGDKQLIPEASSIQDLCDGVALASLVSLYCPSHLPWDNVALPSPSSSVAQAVHNLTLLQGFCQKVLPSDLLHFNPEDVTFLRSETHKELKEEGEEGSASPPAAGATSSALAMLSCAHAAACIRRKPSPEELSSMSQNMLTFLADMFNVLEIHPVRSVCFPGQPANLSLTETRNSQGVGHKRSLAQPILPIPDLRSNLSLTPVTKSPSSLSQPSAGTMVQMTSSSLRRTMSLHHTAVPDQQDERKQFVVHRTKGVPTLLNSSRDETDDASVRMRHAKEIYNQDSKAEERGEIPAAGKPSNWEVQRRSSTPQFPSSAERGSSTLSGRRSRRNSLSADESQLTVENFGGSQENLHFIGRNPDKEPAVHTGRKSEVREKEDREKPTAVHEVHRLSSVDMNNSTGLQDAMSFAPHHNKPQQQSEPPKSSLLTQPRQGDKKTASFAALPNTTTWSQQQQQQQHQEAIPTHEEGQLMAAQLHNIRLKLEEKRRHIESDKRRTEIALSKQRQKVGKAAFLQAVTKGRQQGSAAGDGAKDNKQLDRPVTLKEINDDVVAVESRWLSKESSPLPVAPPEDPGTPNMDNEDIETYHQSLAQMNSSLHDLQADIIRLANRQQHIHQVLEQGPPAAHSQQQQQQQAPGEFFLHSGSQPFEASPQKKPYNFPSASAPTSFASHSTPNTYAPNPSYTAASPPNMYTPPNAYNASPPNTYAPNPPNAYNPNPPNAYTPNPPNTYTPTPPPRRTWANPNPQPPVDAQNNSHAPNFWMDPRRQSIPKYSQPNQYTPPAQQAPVTVQQQPPPAGGGFTVTVNQQQQQPPAGGGFMLHSAPADPSSAYTLHNGTSPQHKQTLTKLSQMMYPAEPVEERTRASVSPVPVHHAPIPAPPEDSMAPQSISFIEMTTSNSMNNSADSNDALSMKLQGLNITSGSRTYRLPSPTRPPPKARPSYQNKEEQDEEGSGGEETAPTQVLRQGVAADKGFYITFEEAPKRPKPPLRTRKMAHRKEQQLLQQQQEEEVEREMSMVSNSASLMSRLSPPVTSQPSYASPQASHHYQQQHEYVADEAEEEIVANIAGEGASGLGLVIGSELVTPDPGALDAMEKKKEKILLASLRRRQQQEENKARKELAAAMAKEREQAREERVAFKREEDKARRAAILQQYKLKKAIEEAEREGKSLDKAEIQRLQAQCSTPNTGPKMRAKGPGMQRPRPKTIHIDRSEAGNGEGGFRRSATNIAADSTPRNGGTMRRAGDSYFGSQDNLSSLRRKSLNARESPDDGRGVSPSRSNQLGRQGSYRTSRETTRRSPSQPRSLQRTATNRRSSSLMNLSGSSGDQDSMAYARYGETDSGLGRATPPRRAPSPGIGGSRHLPSPSGPGSLPPGLMSKRRPFDDASSDISSSASSMMDYTGPRLYRQPTMKSNRGIMLNAVEYCVFPGVVNREAKRRVLEEIARSESKHFLILFRDTGCQFRALYSYCPEQDEVLKLYGTGPRQVTHNMLDNFFKYNSGGKCFSQVHTKHLTVTIDAFTIHNSLWQGKKVSLPNKRDMSIVI